MRDIVNIENANRVQSALRAAVRRILRPLVRVLLRNGIDCGTFEEEVRRAYVSVAMQDFPLEGRRPTVSRAATLTGLSRKEVARLLETPATADGDRIPAHNRAAAVVAGWVRDPDFQDGRGAPRPLSMEDAAGGFPALVRRFSGDMPPRAVFDDLIRVGAVERLSDGRARLVARSYVPSQDDVAKLEIFGTDVSYLMETICHNLDHSGPAARYQRKVMYDDVPTEQAQRFRALAAERCQALLEDLDRELAQSDRGLNPELTGPGRHVTGVGLFYFEEDLASPADDPGANRS